MLTRSIRFECDGRGDATSGFAWTSARFHVWDEDAPTAETWARELAEIALAPTER